MNARQSFSEGVRRGSASALMPSGSASRSQRSSINSSIEDPDDDDDNNGQEELEEASSVSNANEIAVDVPADKAVGSPPPSPPDADGEVEIRARKKRGARISGLKLAHVRASVLQKNPKNMPGWLHRRFRRGTVRPVLSRTRIVPPAQLD